VICERCQERVSKPRGPRIDERGRRLARIHWRIRGGERRPLLRLTGKWLREAGFDLGQRLAIEAAAGRLVIRAV